MKVTALFYFGCLAAAWAPVIRHHQKDTITSGANFPGWAQAPISVHSAPAPLGERETRFAADFPGQVAVFREEERIVLVRWTAAPNRRLHPAADCLRAMGYAIAPGPLYVADDHSHWGTLTARRGHEDIHVRERIVDSAGQEWTDVSSWYWSALLGRSVGPWWALTIFESENPLRGDSPN